MKFYTLILLLFLPKVLLSQEVLEEYISYGLDNNLALKQKVSGYEKSLEALKEARGLFYPNISLNARYTLSEGGRVIEFPVGDLLNPVYNTLNSLTSSTMFPMIDNQEIKFLRPTEHETKIRVAQPLFNPEIYYNSKIRKELSLYDEIDVEQYKRELVTEIKKAYYNVSVTSGIYDMLIETRKLLLENIRVNKRLISNDKVTVDYLYRSEAELSKFDQELQNAEKNNRIAGAYFNFLLNKPLTDSIILKEPLSFPKISDLTTDYSASATENREELKKLEKYININEFQLKMNQSGNIPDLFVVVDYGFQGEQYKFNKDQDYLQASAVLSWNLFSGFQNRAKIKQALIQKEIVESQIEEVRQKIGLQVINTLNELLTAEKGITAAENRVKNAAEAFRLVNRKYLEGQANLIEFMDARTSLTQARENLIVSKYTYLSCFAEFEKATAINNPVK